MYFPNERGKFGIGREHSRSPFGATLDWYDDLSTPYASARQRCVSDPSHTVPVAPLNTYTFLKIWIGPNEQIWGEKFPRAPVRALARTDGVGDYPCDHKIHLPSEQGVGDVGTGPNSRKEQNRHKMRSPKVFIRPRRTAPADRPRRVPECQRKIWISCENAWKICFEYEHFERKIYYSVEL